MEQKPETMTEHPLDQTKEHIIEYPIPQQIRRQLEHQADDWEGIKIENNTEAESRTNYQKRKRQAEKQSKRKSRKRWLAFACVLVVMAGVLCGTVIAGTINTPHGMVEIASANAQYAKHTVTDAVSGLWAQLPWNQDDDRQKTEHSDKDADEKIPVNTEKEHESAANNGEDDTSAPTDLNMPVDTQTTTGSALVTPDNSNGIDPTKPMVALTFDDGPSQYTWSIVNTLQQHNAHATFFLVGNRVATHKSAIDFTLANGNLIASHGFSHQNLVKLTDEEALAQIQQVDSVLQSQHNYTPTLFRVPYGEKDNRVLTILRGQSKPVIGWSVDPRDWEVQDKDKVVAHVLSRVQDGDIVLMHDLYKPTADAVAELVPALQERGYQLVTVSELFQYKGITLQPGGYYRSANGK